jgi:FkbH-like protein
VRAALPEVLVPDWPSDCMLYKSALLGLRCFDVPAISTVDLERTQMYVSERQRSALKRQVPDVDEWLKSLEMKVKVEDLNEANFQRVVQLLNKTNQMNLSTRRLTESELTAWAGQPRRKLWSFRVSDHFGDSGLTGVVSLEMNGSTARIVDFILSCRVMGRNVEQTMLHIAVQHARAAGIADVVAEYKPTLKNKPCVEFFKKSGFVKSDSPDVFHWDARCEYPAPEHIQLERLSTDVCDF